MHDLSCIYKLYYNLKGRNETNKDPSSNNSAVVITIFINLVWKVYEKIWVINTGKGDITLAQKTDKLNKDSK